MLFALRSLALASAALAAASLVGCRSDETIAKQDFAREHTCPEDRITVTKRSDLSPVALMFRPASPSKEVAADPARLELWNKEQSKQAAQYEGKNVVHARGCDREVFYVCGNLRVSVGATRYLCAHATYPPK